MPEMNGYDAAKAIRIIEIEIGGRVPIIALTAGVIKGEREKCLEAGMDDYITKPVVKSTIRTIVSQWLEMHSSRHSEETQQLSENTTVLHFDINDFSARMGKHSAHMLKKLIPLTYKSMEANFNELHQCYEQKNLLGINTIGHKLKGTSLSMSLSLLAELSGKLEDLHEFDEKVVEDLLKKIDAEIQYVTTILNQVEL
jgi:response regulator RpfG family c-di-GMP phosphodiesterase